MRLTRMMAELAAHQPGSAGSRNVPEVAALSGLLLSVSLALSVGTAVAQSVSRYVPVSAACSELNQTVMTQALNGRLDEAEIALSEALAGGVNSPEHSCAGLVLGNMAAHMSVSGRLADAERLAERSVTILEKNYPPDDLVLLRPLQNLTAARLGQGKTAKAREAVTRMRSIRIERPEDRALVHGMAATLLHAEGRRPEAESEYVAAFSAWEEAGRGDTADAGAVLNFLGSLYVEERRLDEARRTLDRALAVFTSAKDSVPMDRIKLLNDRGVLHVRQGKWWEAEQDLYNALSMADCESTVDPVAFASLLANYAHVLRKNHRRREARSIEARAAVLHSDRATDAIVDVADLRAKPKPTKK